MSPLHVDAIDYDLSTSAANPSSPADLVLVIAGVFLQGFSGNSKGLSFLLGTDTYRHSNELQLPVDLELLALLTGWLRSLFAIILLMVVRKLVMDALLAPAQAANWMLLRDVLFHLQCRLAVAALLCLFPRETTISPATANFLVLVASTLSQSVFRSELQSAHRRVVRMIRKENY